MKKILWILTILTSVIIGIVIADIIEKSDSNIIYEGNAKDKAILIKYGMDNFNVSNTMCDDDICIFYMIKNGTRMVTFRNYNYNDDDIIEVRNLRINEELQIIAKDLIQYEKINKVQPSLNLNSRIGEGVITVE